ncbi:unnamed protein product [Microthlaspi erraticum]|uniref:Uncharacterized protein n=1 Tax=Microthlaspi erraticum TaxID=1685480 RepID=A0A6D2J8W3_9BRAS|nr:unnamed protein product [Microthlaspi erraticum]
MQTRSRGKSNLLSSDELQRAERAKRERQRQNRVEAESSSGFQTGSELHSVTTTLVLRRWQITTEELLHRELFHHKPGIQLKLNVRQDKSELAIFRRFQRIVPALPHHQSQISTSTSRQA